MRSLILRAATVALAILAIPSAADAAWMSRRATPHHRPITAKRTVWSTSRCIEQRRR